MRPAGAVDRGVEADQRERGIGSATSVAESAKHRDECRVGPDAPVRKEPVLLRDVADLAAEPDRLAGADIDVTEEDLPGIRVLEAVDAAEDGALPGAALADQRQTAPAPDRQRDSIEPDDGAITP